MAVAGAELPNVSPRVRSARPRAVAGTQFSRISLRARRKSSRALYATSPRPRVRSCKETWVLLRTSTRPRAVAAAKPMFFPRAQEKWQVLYAFSPRGRSGIGAPLLRVRARPRAVTGTELAYISRARARGMASAPCNAPPIAWSRCKGDWALLRTSTHPRAVAGASFPTFLSARAQEKQSALRVEPPLAWSLVRRARILLRASARLSAARERRFCAFTVPSQGVGGCSMQRAPRAGSLWQRDLGSAEHRHPP